MRIELDFDGATGVAHGDIAALIPPNEVQPTPRGWHFAYEIEGLPDWMLGPVPDEPSWWKSARNEIKRTLRDALAGTAVSFDPGAPVENLRVHAPWQRLRAEHVDVTQVIAWADPRYRAAAPIVTPDQIAELTAAGYAPGSRHTRLKCWRHDHTSGGQGRGTCVVVMPDGGGVYCWGQHGELDGQGAYISAGALLAKLRHEPSAAVLEDTTLNALREWIAAAPDAADARRGATAVLTPRGWSPEQVRVWVAGVRLERQLRDPAPRPRPRDEKTFRLFWDADLQRPAQYLADEGRLDPSITPTRTPDFVKQFPALLIPDVSATPPITAVAWDENKAWVKSACDGDVSRAIRMGMTRARCAPVPRLFNDTEWTVEAQVPVRVLPPAVANRKHWTDAGAARDYVQQILATIPTPFGLDATESRALRLSWLLPALTETFPGAMPLMLFVGGTGAGKGVTVRAIQRAWRYHFAGDLMVGSPGEVDNRLLAGRNGGVWLLDELADDGGAAIDAKVLAHLKSVMTCERHGVRIFHRQHIANLRMNHAWYSTARSFAAMAQTSKVENDWRRRCVTIQFPQEHAKPEYVRQLAQFAEEFRPLDVAHALRAVVQATPALDEKRRAWTEAWPLAMPGWQFLAGLAADQLALKLDAEVFDRLPVDNSPVEFFIEWWLSNKAKPYREPGKRWSFLPLRDYAKDKREFRWAEKSNLAFDLQRATGGNFPVPSDGNGTAPGIVSVYTNRSVEWRYSPKDGGGGEHATPQPSEPLPVLRFERHVEVVEVAAPLPVLRFDRSPASPASPAASPASPASPAASPAASPSAAQPLPKLQFTGWGAAPAPAAVHSAVPVPAPIPTKTPTPDLPMWVVDFESASWAERQEPKRDEVNLRTVGAYRYWEAANVEATCMVAASRGKTGSHVVIWTQTPLDFTRLASVREPAHLLHPHVWKHLTRPVTIELFSGPECPAPLAAHIGAGGQLTAHNAQFDARAWRRMGWPEPAAWNDTMHATRALLGTGSLDDALQQLYEQGKVDRPTAFVPWRALSPEKRLGLVAYCASDAIPSLGLAHDLFPKLTENEREESRADFRMNDRGFAVDRELCAGIVDLNGQIRDKIEADLCAAVGITPKALNSPQQLAKFLAGLGLEVNSVDGRVLQEVLDADDTTAGGDQWHWRSDPPVSDEDVAKALLTIEARLDFAGITGGKALKRLEEANTKDGRAHDQIQHRKARTGRSAGARSQPQNDPRHELDDKQLEPILAAVREKNLTGLHVAAAHATGLARAKVPTANEITPADALSACLRSTIVAGPGRTLRRFDYEQIEARCVAWLARQDDLLAAFAAGADVYSQFGEAWLFKGEKLSKKTTPVKRQACKIVILGSGYQMGRARLGFQLRKERIDVAALGLTVGRINEAYRSAYPMIAGKVVNTWAPKDLPAGEVPFGIRRGGLWDDLGNAALRVGDSGAGYSEPVCDGRVLLSNEGGDVFAELPSGRRLVYPKARVEPKVGRWGGKPKPAFTYQWGGQPVDMYGGKWTENLSQAICYDLLQHAVRTLERELPQIEVVLTVHDEIVIERAAGDAALDAAIEHHVAAAPAWARGWPVSVEGK